MASGVLVLGVVAAADVTAAQAGAEMNPAVAEGDALVADVGRRVYGDDRHQMRAGHTAGLTAGAYDEGGRRELRAMADCERRYEDGGRSTNQTGDHLRHDDTLVRQREEVLRANLAQFVRIP